MSKFVDVESTNYEKCQTFRTSREVVTNITMISENHLNRGIDYI